MISNTADNPSPGKIERDFRTMLREGLIVHTGGPGEGRWRLSGDVYCHDDVREAAGRFCADHASECEGCALSEMGCGGYERGFDSERGVFMYSPVFSEESLSRPVLVSMLVREGYLKR